MHMYMHIDIIEICEPSGRQSAFSIQPRSMTKGYPQEAKEPHGRLRTQPRSKSKGAGLAAITGTALDLFSAFTSILNQVT